MSKVARPRFGTMRLNLGVFLLHESIKEHTLKEIEVFTVVG